MKPLLSIAVLLSAGCGGLEGESIVDPPDDSFVSEAMKVARPEPLIDMVLGMRDFVGVEPGCPVVQVDLNVADDARHEIWTGGCRQGDGTIIEGVLELFDGPDASWVAGEGFTVRGPDGLDLYVDGAIELLEQGELLLLDTAATWCGGPGTSCEGDVATLDLAYTIYPLAGYPTRYDATVGGTVNTGDGLVSIEGTWSIDSALCQDEPASGTFAVSGAERHSVEMDGADQCDDCAIWVVQGVEVAPFCGVDL